MLQREAPSTEASRAWGSDSQGPQEGSTHGGSVGLRMQPSCPRAGKGGVSLLLLLGGASPSAPPTALPQDLVCIQPRGFGGGPVLIGHCQARLSPLLQFLLLWLQARPLCPSFTPIGPAGTWAPQLSPGPHCSPARARPSVPPKGGNVGV